MKSLKAFTVVAAALMLTSCSTNIIASLGLEDRIKGAWRMADDYGYCHVSIGDSTLCFVDNTPEKHYKYVLVKDTLKVLHGNMNAVLVAMHGDTLGVSPVNDAQGGYSLLPFEAVNIHGINRPIPTGNDSLSNEKLSEILLLLSMERVDEGSIRKWNDLLVYTNPEARKEVDRYAAKRYKKHPKRFLKWIYSQRGRNSNEIADGGVRRMEKDNRFSRQGTRSQANFKAERPAKQGISHKTARKRFPRQPIITAKHALFFRNYGA